MDLVQTLGYMDTVVGFGLGAVSMLAVLTRKKSSNPAKVASTLQEYQVEYGHVVAEIGRINDRHLALKHDFLSQWPTLDLEESTHKIPYLTILPGQRDDMLLYLNELDKTHVDRKRLRVIRKELSDLIPLMAKEADEAWRYLDLAEDRVKRALKNVREIETDHARMTALFEKLTALVDKVKSNYDPLYISDVGPAYIAAEEAMEKYHALMISPDWRLASKIQKIATWGGVPANAHKAVDELHNILDHALNFQRRVFRGTKFLRDTVNQFAKSDPMLYDKIMRTIVEAENHAYVTRNPNKEFEDIIAPAIRILEPKN